MDILQDELAKLHRDANLTQSIQDVDKIIEQLERARASIVAGRRASFVQVLKIGGCGTSNARKTIRWTSLSPFYRSKFSIVHSCKDPKSPEEWLR